MAGKMDKPSFISQILELNPMDICGEQGEYHTVVLDGPIFNKKIKVEEAEVVLKDGYWFLDIKQFSLKRKTRKKELKLCSSAFEEGMMGPVH